MKSAASASRSYGVSRSTPAMKRCTEDAGSGELLVEGLELRYALFKEGAVQNPGESAITCIPPWMAALLYHKPWP